MYVCVYVYICMFVYIYIYIYIYIHIYISVVKSFITKSKQISELVNLKLKLLSFINIIDSTLYVMIHTNDKI